MARECHHIMLTHALSKPVAQSRPSKIVELSCLDGRSTQNLLELPCEIVDDLVPGITEIPLTLPESKELDADYAD